VILAVVLLAAIHAPEECLVTRGKAAVTVEHQGKTYRFKFADCRDEFLSDPERYSQLYDALLELHAEGAAIESAPPSLVPS
jgi:YHS domain-containing protein